MSGSSDPTRPFVLIAAGQSNIGFDNGGPKTVGPNILISNHLTNPTGFAPGPVRRRAAEPGRGRR